MVEFTNGGYFVLLTLEPLLLRNLNAQKTYIG
jgi:hypothetical protein